jgi:hypothetical protein
MTNSPFPHFTKPKLQIVVLPLRRRPRPRPDPDLKKQTERSSIVKSCLIITSFSFTMNEFIPYSYKLTHPHPTSQGTCHPLELCWLPTISTAPGSFIVRMVTLSNHEGWANFGDPASGEGALFNSPTVGTIVTCVLFSSFFSSSRTSSGQPTQPTSPARPRRQRGCDPPPPASDGLAGKRVKAFPFRCGGSTCICILPAVYGERVGCAGSRYSVTAFGRFLFFFFFFSFFF